VREGGPRAEARGASVRPAARAAAAAPDPRWPPALSHCSETHAGARP
jgi:hypothetical protein